MDGTFSGGDFLVLDSVDEGDSLNGFWAELVPVEGSPFLLGGLHELEDDGEAGGSATAPFTRGSAAYGLDRNSQTTPAGFCPATPASRPNVVAEL